MPNQRSPPASADAVAEVADWCAGALADETSQRRADDSISLTKAALLIALEEEAAAAAASAASAAPPHRTSGGAATWSLSRLDALADEALRRFAARHGPEDALPAAPPPAPEGAPETDANAPSAASGLEQQHPAPLAAPNPAQMARWLLQQVARGGAGAPGGLPAWLQAGLATLFDTAPAAAPGGGEKAPAAGDQGGAAGGAAPLRVAWYDGVRPASPGGSTKAPAAAPAEAAAADTLGGTDDTAPAAEGCAVGAADGPGAAAGEAQGGEGEAEAEAEGVAGLVQRYPLAALQAVNWVLFHRQGYAACNRWGEPSDALLSSVLERGSGGCAALCILYVSVCARAGLPMHFRVLRDDAGSHYCVAWPAAAPLRAPGVGRCVVDVYGRGALLTVDEVCELFAVSEEQLLSPSSRRQLLAALLSDLLAAHWAAACGCPPSPRARVPLLPAAALEGRVRSLDGASLARAAAAAAKRAALLPRSQEARLQLGLLHYFQGDYQDAWLELGILLEQAAAADATDAWPAAAAGSEAPPPARAAAGGGGGEGEERLPPEVLAGAELLFEKLRLELLVAA